MEETEEKEFCVWNGEEGKKIIGDESTVEEGAWSWGCCKDARCNHASHDAYSVGDCIRVRCRKTSERYELDGLIHYSFFETPKGLRFCYFYRRSTNPVAFAPECMILPVV